MCGANHGCTCHNQDRKFEGIVGIGRPGNQKKKELHFIGLQYPSYMCLYGYLTTVTISKSVFDAYFRVRGHWEQMVIASGQVRCRDEGQTASLAFDR